MPAVISPAETRVTTGSATNRDRRSARERLLDAANELFYEEGVHTVGIDRVIERAGVAKASLYNTFGSKEELVKAYLTQRRVTRQERITGKIARFDTPRDQLIGVFDALAELISEPSFRGCAFLNVSSESHGDGVTEICDNSRGWTRALFTRLAGEAGATDPATLASRLVLLYDGAMVGAKMDRNHTGIAAARDLAETLVDAAIASPSPTQS